MSLNIVSNFAANVAHRNLVRSDNAATSSLAKLSSGTRVLGAKDDAASLAIGSRLNAEVAGLKQAAVNAGQAISMLQIADGAMAKVNDIMTRMKALSIQSGSGQLGSDERAMLDTEYQALLSEVDRISNDTDFAGTTLVTGSSVIAGATNHVAAGVANITYRGDFSGAATATLDFTAATGVFDLVHNGITYTGTLSGGAGAITVPEVVTLSESTTSNKIDIALAATFVTGGDLSDAAVTNALTSSGVSSFTFKVGTGVSSSADTISIDVNSIAANALGIDGTDISTQANSDLASVQIATAIDSLQTARAVVGANQNRLDFAAANIATASENTEAARSQLLDLDVASEMTIFTSKQILVQAGVSMLAQANQLPQNLLQLFR